jgi:hypothetical protein
MLFLSATTLNRKSGGAQWKDLLFLPQPYSTLSTTQYTSGWNRNIIVRVGGLCRLRRFLPELAFASSEETLTTAPLCHVYKDVDLLPPRRHF